MQQQRSHQRIHFFSRVSLVINGVEMDAFCLDLSMRGALLVRPENIDIHLEQPVTIRFDGKDGSFIEMHGAVAHVSEDAMGCACDCLDLTSMVLLQRLLEEHIGTSATDRELSTLMLASA